jgi:hypothetical protein
VIMTVERLTRTRDSGGHGCFNTTKSQQDPRIRAARPLLRANMQSDT